MKIAVVGTGYVGLVSGACLADFGHDVTCIDSDATRVAGLRRGEMPFYEPGLGEMVERHSVSGRLRFTTELTEGVVDAQVVFLAVGTPPASNGEADLSQVTAAVRQMAPSLSAGCVVVTKSTVPVGTGALIRDLLGARVTDADLQVISNPEFLREGSAIADFMRPDRVVIGATSERAAAVMRDIYRPLYLIETPLVFTTIESAEMIKYASNAFLAVKISFINEVANLCERTGADVHVVAKTMGLDKRIGSKFLHPGPGYGGSCFPKDTRALAALGARHDVALDVVTAAIAANDRQREVTVEKIAHAAGSLAEATVAVLGLAFKPNTSDIRESPAWFICQALVARGARVRAFDPAALDEARRALDGDAAAGRLHFASDAHDAATGADVLVIATEWNEFRSLDLDRLRGLMRRPIIVDVRNVLDPDRARAAGFTYVGTGRGAPAPAPATPAAITV
ncbi:MAG: UDP-glucose dehydrogenase family protein [Vicinamibacterales bacterium]